MKNISDILKSLTFAVLVMVALCALAEYGISSVLKQRTDERIAIISSVLKQRTDERIAIISSVLKQRTDERQPNPTQPNPTQP